MIMLQPDTLGIVPANQAGNLKSDKTQLGATRNGVIVLALLLGFKHPSTSILAEIHHEEIQENLSPKRRQQQQQQ